MVRGWIWTLPLIRQAKSVVGLSAEGKESGFHALLQSGVFVFTCDLQVV